MPNEYVAKDDSLSVREALIRQQQASKSLELEKYSHGEYVPGENGQPGGILIDREEVLRQETANPHIDDIKEYLNDMDKRIEAAKQGSVDYEKTKDTKDKEQSIVQKVNPSNPEMSDILKVQQMFAAVEPTPQGLVPADSKDAAQFKKKMKDLEEGKVDLNQYENQQQPQQPELQPKMPQDQLQIESYENNAHIFPEQTVQENDPNVIQSPLPTNAVQFNVDSSKAGVFLTTLSPTERAKIDKAEKIVINEVKNLKIPVATRTITSIEEFRRVLPSKSHSGVIETVNVNSGYVATFKGCGSLALATIIPDDDPTRVDYRKRFQLCYDNLVTTSIGKMSFNDFCANTHINDLPNMLFTILRASDPDENMIELECANCETRYPVKYRLSELLDVDSIPDEMSEKLQEIANNRYTLEDARKVQKTVPIMNSTYLEFTQADGSKTTLELRSPSGSTFIAITPKIPDLISKYSRFIAGILPFIRKAFIEFTAPGETSPQIFEVNDFEAIAEIIKELRKSEIKAIGQYISNITEYPTPRYSFKGNFVCPKCGKVDTNVRCSVDDLIFYRVEQAIE